MIYFIERISTCSIIIIAYLYRYRVSRFTLSYLWGLTRVGGGAIKCNMMGFLQEYI